MAGSSPLPTEVLAGVFGHLSPSYLAEASRVCHNWRTVAFQPLYQTVYLCLASHLEQLVERIRLEDVGSRFSIAAHLKGLVLDIEYLDNREADMIGEADLDSLNKIIPRLTQLNYLSWNLMFVPEDPETFQLFQTQCPKLDSVHIWMKEGIDFYSDQYERYAELSGISTCDSSYGSVFEFKNLSYFSLSIWEMPSSFDEGPHEPLASLLSRCPNLSSIILDLNGEFPYSPSALVDALGDQCVFPRLRRFYAQGREDPEWTEFFEDPESHPFRQFIGRHSGIEDLALGYVEESLHYGNIDPEEMAQLFPSLKYFEGPAFLFRPLVLSTLTDQIETLIIVDKRLRDEVSLTEMYDRVPTLPRLRKFGIWSDDVDEGILVNMLRTIVNATGRLEEIEIHTEIDHTNYGEVMGLIARVGGLRSVTLGDSVLSIDGGNNDEALGWDEFASILRRTCPRLRTIYRPIRKFDKDNREKVWELPNNA